MVKSNAKRRFPARNILRVIGALVLCALIAASIYVYPRRVVSDALSIVPSEGMAACARLRGLGGLWKSCSASAFAALVKKGDIHPLREMIAEDGDFAEDWAERDFSLVVPVAGRDCVAALYAGRGGSPLRAAAWSRIGFRVRAFHLVKRAWGALAFWKKPEIVMKRIGGLSVAHYMDRKTGAPRFSYLLLGDLGVATTGGGGDFWPAVGRLLKGSGASAVPDAKGLADIASPREGIAAGAFVADPGRLADALLPTPRAAGGKPSPRGDPAGALLERLRAIMEEYGKIEGTFELGRRTTITLVAAPKNVPAGPATPLPPHDVSRDPLAAMIGKGGILYAGGASDLRGAVDRARESGEREGVEVVFMRPGEREVLPAEHFTMTWLGGAWSFLLYGGEGGIVQTAASVEVDNPEIAALRLRRYASLADGSRLRVVDGKGAILAGSGESLSVARYAVGPSEIYMARIEGGWGRFFAPVCSLHGDRIIVASSQSLLSLITAGKREGGVEIAEPGRFHAVLRGPEAEKAMLSTRRILSLAGLFVKKGEEKERMARIVNALGYGEWFAPVEEIRVTAAPAENGERVRIEAEFKDI